MYMFQKVSRVSPFAFIFKVNWRRPVGGREMKHMFF